ncbi:MAG: polyphenol oxidase family protein [Bdellovibrionaceae bacterium]|nr:polyphenol oxidase family protein [Bdellovibrionales bacterium]MCB9085534.1 polyphenol oxidase family protein [Pseudobdellovibrionaceae bacterium]
MFEVFYFRNQDIGHVWKTSSHLVFYSNNNVSLPLLTEAFSELAFCSINQIHSTKWVDASNRPTEADAHFSSQIGQALLIKTADCLPIMMTTNQMAIAIHAGWRGLAHGILMEVRRLKIDPSQASVFIGPHIGKKSFEVGQEVVEAFAPWIDSYSLDPQLAFSHHARPEKAYLDLGYLASGQLQHLGFKAINCLPIDTFTSKSHHSYRRDGAQSGRQLSFVARIG